MHSAHARCRSRTARTSSRIRCRAFGAARAGECSYRSPACGCRPVGNVRVIRVKGTAIASATIGVILLALLCFLSGVARFREHAYTVGEIQEGLHYNPSKWIGRVVLVQGTLSLSGTECGIAAGCPYPPWLAVRSNCTAPSRCKVASWEQINDQRDVYVAHAAYAPPLILNVSARPWPRPTILDSIQTFMHNAPFMAPWVSTPRSTYRVKLLPKPSKPCQGQSLQTPCAPEAVRA